MAFFIPAIPAAVPLVGAGLLAIGSFFSGAVTGAATSDKLGEGLKISSFVLGLFLIVLVFVLIKRFGLLRG